MYGDSGCVKIERLANGYNICCKDPKIVAYNKKRDSEPYDSKAGRQPYRDPDRTYTFKTLKEVTDWLTANLDKALPPDDYESAFDKAAKVID